MNGKECGNLIEIRISMRKAEQGWYFMRIYNSNGTMSKVNVRLTKKDFKNIITMYKENPVIKLVVYYPRNAPSGYREDIITDFKFDEKDNLIYEKGDLVI